MPEAKPRCNIVHVIKGKCTRDLNHPPPHAFEYAEMDLTPTGKEFLRRAAKKAKKETRAA